MLKQYIEQQIKVAENQAREERAERGALEQENLEIEKERLKLQMNAEELKAGIERESAERKAALERETAQLPATLDLQRLDKERELLELKNHAEEEHQDDGENAEEAVAIKYKAIRPTIPAFNETMDEIDAYLQRYEKVAEVNKWPEADWALHLSTLLTGQALELYARLPAEEAREYKELKAVLLCRYELTVDGFRKRFHEARRDIDETATEFLGRSSRYLTRWVELAGIERTYDKIFDLIVRDQFVSTCEPHLGVFLREKELTSVKEVAKAADLYLDARKYSNYKVQSKDKVRSTQAKPGSSAKPYTFDKPWSAHVNAKNKNETKDTRTCFKCHKPGHVAKFCTSKGTASAFSNQQRSNKSGGAPASNNVCMMGDERATSAAGGVDLQGIVALAGTTAGQCKNWQIQAGLVGEQAVTVMRDTGCTGAVGRRSLTKPAQLAGTTQTYRMIDGTVRTAPVAKVAITSPFFNGEVNAICIDKPLCDVILGNIKGASDECINAHTEANVVVTRQQAKIDKLPF